MSEKVTWVFINLKHSLFVTDSMSALESDSPETSSSAGAQPSSSLSSTSPERQEADTEAPEASQPGESYF